MYQKTTRNQTRFQANYYLFVFAVVQQFAELSILWQCFVNKHVWIFVQEKDFEHYHRYSANFE